MADAGDDLVWPRERSEQVGDFRHFRVRRDWNRSPDDGELRDFFVLQMPDWVQVIALTPAGEFVMVQQFRPGTRSVTTEFVAGLVEEGESPVETAVRELEEETGHGGGRAEVIGRVFPNAALQDNRLHIVLVNDCRPTGQRNEDPGESIRPILRDPAEIDRMIADGAFQDAYGIVAWGFYRRWTR
ncbi:MAG TPA: NUDIX hydrolase [Longimicrobiales bacterium]|nr:NUDIX hydrolase [Longimicrobiales bacterium]